MNANPKSAVRWPLIVECLGMVIVLLACATGGVATQVTPVSTNTPSLRLDNNVVEVRGENGNWIPMAGESTFELIGGLSSIDPWKVTGNTFATRDSTQIDEGLEIGDWVRVKGLVLADATWLANSIERTEGQENPTITLIGKVDSVDPWVVNGITLEVTSDTVITGDIQPAMIVRVEILLLEGGTWEVISINPLSNFTEIPGCINVMAIVVSVNGKELQLEGWPSITLREDTMIENDQGSEGMLSANQRVLVVVCASDNGQIVITKIVILKTEEDDTSPGGKKVLVCHKPDKKGGHTLSLPPEAVPAHLAHGDKLGACTK